MHCEGPPLPETIGRPTGTSYVFWSACKTQGILGGYKHTSNMLLSLTTRPFFAYKKGPFPATKSLSFARNYASDLTVKADDEGNHLRFLKPVLLFKQFLSRLYGYHLLLVPKSLHFSLSTTLKELYTVRVE